VCLSLSLSLSLAHVKDARSVTAEESIIWTIGDAPVYKFVIAPSVSLARCCFSTAVVRSMLFIRRRRSLDLKRYSYEHNAFEVTTPVYRLGESVLNIRDQ